MAGINETYDVIVVGAGVSGAAQFYALAHYADVAKVLLVEKERTAGLVNSAPTNNSQTLHEGDIETNYTFEKARSIKAKASFTRAYLERKGDSSLFMKGPKMVLGVGTKESAELRERFASFRRLYPDLRLIEHDEVCTLEPHVCAGRPSDEELTALYSENGITVNYGALAASLIDDALARVADDAHQTYVVSYDTAVKRIVRSVDGYVLSLSDGREVHTRVLSVCAGSHSMYFAKQLNIPAVQSLSLLPIAGNFYFTPKYITSKMYTVQTPGLAFSAVHGDPDILDTKSEHTRFGPTTRIVFMLERHRLGTVKDFFAVLPPTFKTLLAYVRILRDRKFLAYALKHNVLFPLPLVGRVLFAREARKIIPLLKVSDVRLAGGQGGVRPQIIRTDEAKPLTLGEAKFADKNALFNVTPSPGASTCLYNGLIDARRIAGLLGAAFDEAQIQNDFGASPE